MLRNWLRVLPLLVIFAYGCSGTPDDQPETGTVTGVVLLDDKPLPDARVLFSPTSSGQSSEGVTDENGKFELRYKRDIMGAKVGEHLVKISTFEQPVIGDDGRPSGGRPELVPQEYNETSSLKRTVEAGENEFEFKLQGGG
ncbi:transthyretin-like family protein [Thalassoroseus pseudoceratinae]|uniref:carboxypeptidase-like regulatory domain-containing protein n=1 Tax=Thalassoroseus pseudoceratinae TaxID=2713176 RepID=UPI0014205F8C|nr:carboxypeptidase-like regulatory domain-containing protein [Thalassoroseus pseudoceratinae]